MNQFLEHAKISTDFRHTVNLLNYFQYKQIDCNFFHGQHFTLNFKISIKVFPSFFKLLTYKYEETLIAS